MEKEACYKAFESLSTFQPTLSCKAKLIIYLKIFWRLKRSMNPHKNRNVQHANKNYQPKEINLVTGNRGYLNKFGFLTDID